MSLAGSLEKITSKIIGKFGGDVTIRYVTAAAYSTTTGASAETESDVTVKGLVEAITKSEVSGLIQAEDKRLTVAADDLATAPGTKDRVVISSVVYQIIAVSTNEHDNTAITYELILRS
tara:strand:- start:287 stop:643 length:357 start_codon:yes stop_codon:yes gene_type:complete